MMMQSALFVPELHHAAVEVDRINQFRAREFPGVAVAQPVFRLFDLLTMADALVEHAVFVTDAVTVTRQPQGGHGVKQAGGKSSQATIAECRVVLDLTNLIEVEPDFHHGLPYLFVELHVEHAVHQGPPDQKFEGEVVDALGVGAVIAALGFHPAFDQAIAHGIRDGMKPVVVGGGVAVLADGIHQAVGERVLERRHVEAEVVVPQYADFRLVNHSFCP